MKTLWTTSMDGTRLAYDRIGEGPAIVLLHGGGGSREEWHEAGYVDRLRETYTVVTPDLRGHGESGQPTDPTDYAIEHMIEDVLAVADACGAERFVLWGMSYGGKVGRYVATRTDRIERFAMIGTQLGLGVSGELRRQAVEFCDRWPSILEAQRSGSLDPASLPETDRVFLAQFNVHAMLGWVRAMLDWPATEPADFRCPTLWLFGSEDVHAVESFRIYEHILSGSRVQTQMLERLDHEGVFEATETTFPILLSFTQG